MIELDACLTRLYRQTLREFCHTEVTFRVEQSCIIVLTNVLNDREWVLGRTISGTGHQSAISWSMAWALTMMS